MARLVILVLFGLSILCVEPVAASVELARSGQSPTVVDEVYLRDGRAFLALDDVLPALGLSGSWDPVRHVYTIKTPQGAATLFPGGHYLRVGERFLPLSRPPRFIDARLRVPEEFVTGPLAELLQSRVYYRNLNPPAATAEKKGTALDRLFAFLLQKKGSAVIPKLRGVALDPGHGGQDPGSFNEGLKEKNLVLDVADRLEKQLKMKLGIPVYLSRDADYAVSAAKRLQTAAHQDVDALIQLHAQSALSDEPAGVMLFIRPVEERDGREIPAAEGQSMQLAEALETALTEAHIPVAGIFPAPLLPLGRGDLPTVLVELGFLSNPVDRTRLADQAGRQTLTLALFKGLKAFGDETTEVSR